MDRIPEIENAERGNAFLETLAKVKGVEYTNIVFACTLIMTHLNHRAFVLAPVEERMHHLVQELVTNCKIDVKDIHALASLTFEDVADETQKRR